jgi:hypothetical protein
MQSLGRLKIVEMIIIKQVKLWIMKMEVVQTTSIGGLWDVW